MPNEQGDLTLDSEDIRQLSFIMTDPDPSDRDDYTDWVSYGFLQPADDGWAEVTPNAASKYPMWAKLDKIVKASKKKNIAISNETIAKVKTRLESIGYTMIGFNSTLSEVTATKETDESFSELRITGKDAFLTRTYKDGSPGTFNGVNGDVTSGIKRIIANCPNRWYDLMKLTVSAIQALGK